MVARDLFEEILRRIEPAGERIAFRGTCRPGIMVSVSGALGKCPSIVLTDRRCFQCFRLNALSKSANRRFARAMHTKPFGKSLPGW